MNDLYLTSTFTHEWNRKFNPQIGAALEAQGFTCYLPHRDTDQSASPEAKFTNDISGIKNTKLILAIGLHESPNWGAEVGYAYAQGKPIICLTSKNHQIPLICNGMITETIAVDNIDGINSYVDELSLTIRKHL